MEESCQIHSSHQGREKILRIIADSWHFLLAPHPSPSLLADIDSLLGQEIELRAAGDLADHHNTPKVEG